MDVLEKSYRRKSVQRLFDLKTSTLYEQMAKGLFPPPDYHQGRMPMWRESTLVRHQQAQIKADGKPRALAERDGGEAAI